LGPTYQRPDAGAPEAFRGEPAAAAQLSFGDLPWWDVFKDETLKGLIQTALANNYDLRVAVTHVEQARAVAMQTRSQFFPQVGYEFEAARGRNTFLGNPAAFAGGSSTGGASRTMNSFLGLLDASWEVDLWGRIRRLNESAQAQLLATEEARRGVLVTLVSDVAQAYYELLELDLQLDIAQHTTDSYAKSLRLFQERFVGGVGTRLETSRAEASLASTAAGLWSLGANLTGPIFEGGRLIGQYRGAWAAWDQAAIQYQQTALTAFQEVADALASRDKLRTVFVLQTRAVGAYQEAVGLALDRDRFGKANYFEVIDAQDQLFATQLALAQTRRDQFLAIVQLYKALGGVWALSDQPL